jgi:hypothetical protein
MSPSDMSSALVPLNPELRGLKDILDKRVASAIAPNIHVAILVHDYLFILTTFNLLQQP